MNPPEPTPAVNQRKRSAPLMPSKSLAWKRGYAMGYRAGLERRNWYDEEICRLRLELARAQTPQTMTTLLILFHGHLISIPFWLLQRYLAHGAIIIQP